MNWVTHRKRRVWAIAYKYPARAGDTVVNDIIGKWDARDADACGAAEPVQVEASLSASRSTTWMKSSGWIADRRHVLIERAAK